MCVCSEMLHELRCFYVHCMTYVSCIQSKRSYLTVHHRVENVHSFVTFPHAMDHNETLLPSAALRTCVTLQSLRNAGLVAAAALPIMIPGNTWRGNVVQTLDFRIYDYSIWNEIFSLNDTKQSATSSASTPGKARLKVETFADWPSLGRFRNQATSLTSSVDF